MELVFDAFDGALWQKLGEPSMRFGGGRGAVDM